MLAENEDLIERIVHSPEIDERRELVNELVESIPMIILKKIEQKKADMEKIIRDKNPDVADVDLGTVHKDLLYWDELDKTRVIKSISFTGVEDNIKKLLLDDVAFAVCGLISKHGARRCAFGLGASGAARSFSGFAEREAADRQGGGG